MYVVSLLLLLSACATEPYRGKTFGTKRETTTTTKTTLPGTDVTRETIKPEPHSLAMIRSPKRDASLQVVDRKSVV